MGPVIVPPPFDDLEDRILPWSQVKVICGLSRTTVWRMQKTGDFPACVQVSLNRVGWWQSELLAWRRARTPRRLPEPRQIAPARAPEPEESVVIQEDQGPPTEAEVASASSNPSRTARRKPKAAAPDNQTAFDFGG